MNNRERNINISAEEINEGAKTPSENSVNETGNEQVVFEKKPDPIPWLTEEILLYPIKNRAFENNEGRSKGW